jgi:Photoprotection regulator fluorescence recovery protein
MQASEIDWSVTEQQVAQEAFDKAYRREMNALLEAVREKSSSIVALEDIWHLNDLLSAKRHELDGKYEYEYSVLIFVFAKLVKEGWLDLNELAGLESSKRAKIAALARM